MKFGACEFQTGSPIDSNSYESYSIDIHHVFPRKWCANNQIDPKIGSCIVNKTPVDAHTAKLIRGLAPSAYLAKIENSQGMNLQILGRILASHDIDQDSLVSDDFQSFFDHRFESIIQQIERVMGKPVNRGSLEEESPFSGKSEVSTRENLMHLIHDGESSTVEFKSTGRRSLRSGMKDQRVEWAVVKSICAFLNSDGGTLLVGVGDKGAIIGIEEDYEFLKSADSDRWSLWLTDLIGQITDHVATTYLDITFINCEGGTVARIHVKPSINPVFATDKDKHKVFFVRTNNSTNILEGRELIDYLEKRF